MVAGAGTNFTVAANVRTSVCEWVSVAANTDSAVWLNSSRVEWPPLQEI